MTDKLPRRELLKSAVVAGGATLLASNRTAAEEKRSTEKCSPVSLDKPRVVTPSLVGPMNVSVNVSPDKLALTFLLDSLQATYGPEMAAQKFTPVKTAFLEIPVTAGSDPQCQLLGYTIDVRGNADLTAGARAAVTVVIGGDAFQIEFPFDNAGSHDFKRRFFAVSRLAGTPGMTVVRSPLQVQIIAQVETAQPTDAAVLTIDSVDVEARRA